MISINRATETDIEIIEKIGMISVEEAHRESCPAKDLKEYLEKNYNPDAIRNELANSNNIYHILYYEGKAAGFSKIELNASHPAVGREDATKLDRIYLLKEYFDLKLGLNLLNFNVEYSKAHQQSGMWLFTWTGNTRAVNFYRKAGFKIIGEHYFKVSETHSNPNHHMFLSYGGN